MNKLVSKITGEEITLQEYFENLEKSFIEEYDGQEIYENDIKAWVDDDTAYEPAVLDENYDFITEEEPIKKSETENDEYIKKMTMSALLILLEKQNEII